MTFRPPAAVLTHLVSRKWHIHLPGFSVGGSTSAARESSEATLLHFTLCFAAVVTIAAAVDCCIDSFCFVCSSDSCQWLVGFGLIFPHKCDLGVSFRKEQTFQTPFGPTNHMTQSRLEFGAEAPMDPLLCLVARVSQGHAAVEERLGDCLWAMQFYMKVTIST